MLSDYKIYSKALLVLNSCKTKEQFEVARNYLKFACKAVSNDVIFHELYWRRYITYPFIEKK